MRDLTCKEQECVAGGDWHLGFDLGVVDGWIEGDEDLGDIAAATATAASGAYWGARDAMADFYESVANFFATSCNSGGGGR